MSREVLRSITDPSLKQVVGDALKRGWVVEHTGKHVRLTWPGGGQTWTSTTKCRGRASANLAATLRRIERASQ